MLEPVLCHEFVPFAQARREFTSCFDGALDVLSDIEFIDTFMLSWPVSISFVTDVAEAGVRELGMVGEFVRTQWDEVVVDVGGFECAVPVPFADHGVICAVALP